MRVWFYCLVGVVVLCVFAVFQYKLNHLVDPFRTKRVGGRLFLESGISWEIPPDWPLAAWPPIGEQLQLVPMVNGSTRRVCGGVFFAYILVIAAIFGIYTEHIPMAVFSFGALLGVDIVVTYLWYCTDILDIMSCVSASPEGLLIARISGARRVPWTLIDVHVYRIGLSLVRATFDTPLGRKVLILSIEDANIIIATMESSCRVGANIPAVDDLDGRGPCS